METQQPEQWAIIELMGHQKIAGRYSEHGPMHRVDVPDREIRRLAATAGPDETIESFDDFDDEEIED